MKRSKLLIAVREYFARKLILSVGDKYRGLSLAEKCKHGLEMLNIRIKARRRLRKDLIMFNREPGLIISNHPSDVEQLIMPALAEKHPNFKIIVRAALIKHYHKLGQKHFIPAVLPDLEIEAPEAISQGHLVGLFPSGGREHKFRRGFVKIVERLAPKTMVYCLHINERGLKEKILGSKWRQMMYYSGLGSEIFFTKWLNINRLLPHRAVDVDGLMVTAGDFQEVMRSQPDDLSKAKAAQEHYDELFNRNKQKYYKKTVAKLRFSKHFLKGRR